MIRYFRDDRSLRRALAWLAFFAAIGLALVLLYRDADQQDSGYHFLFARWAHRHPRYFVGVWARPLFTLLYFPFAQFGYAAAKFFTVIISLATAWQTFRLARQIGFDRASRNVCHAVARLMILVRPEGFFIGVLWGVWVLRIADRGSRIEDRGLRIEQRYSMRSSISYLLSSISYPRLLLLASGMILWLLAAYLIMLDPLWIVHDWPSDWRPDGKANGTGPIWWYVASLPLIVGPLLVAPFISGLWRLLKRREFTCGVSAFLVLFVAHSLMFWRGWFGSAGYARYFVC